MRVVAVVPARDEAETVGAVVRGLLAHGIERVIVSDNASRDETAAEAIAAGAEVVREETLGYGAACLAALARIGSTGVSPEAVLFCDADGSSDTAEAPRLVAAIQAGADLAVGARRPAEAGSMTIPQRFGTSLAASLVRLLWRTPCADLGPFRAIRWGALQRLGMRDRTWGWTVEMQIRAAEENLLVAEVPVGWFRRAGGRSKISGTLSGVLRAGVRILWTIYSLRARRRGGSPLAFGVLGALILAALVALLSARALSTNAPPGAPSGPGSQPRPASLRGIAFALHPAPGSNPPRAVGEIADLGAGAVEIVVPYWQRDTGSSDPGPRPGRTPTEDEIRASLRAARARGMRVWILPIVLLEEPGEKGWRGLIDPADRPAWWRSYREIVARIARIGAEEGAEGLAVGSELISFEGERSEWLETIAAARAGFHGLLTYSANWDHYEAVTFWDALDVVGVSAYYEVGRDGASDESLRVAWARERDRLLAFASWNARPLLLTEVGYPAVRTGLEKPWDYTAVEACATCADNDADAVQTRGLAAFVETWDGAWPGFFGAFVYEWDEKARRSLYSPRRRPSEAIVRAWCLGRAPADGDDR